MPTYQYRCQDCSSQLEVVQKFTDDALTECPTCHGPLRKVFSAVGVVFKGSGFYATDSRAAKKKASASSGAAKDDLPGPTGPAAQGLQRGGRGVQGLRVLRHRQPGRQEEGQCLLRRSEGRGKAEHRLQHGRRQHLRQQAVERRRHEACHDDQFVQQRRTGRLIAGHQSRSP